ncbi:ribonucleoside-diphosphate reductase [Lacticaseibacillus suilingensis]|uniref:ribonucleoside-diphosphate reductase n=1 Tax=Lacticaseibacillus suilingensis TaxID=2799577 RepID=UPI0022E6748F|nr:ribonucleoside-diphosphate reductase [Lacticaseibacillus suilingensis]
MSKIWNTDYGNVCDVEHSIIEHLSREEQRMKAIIYTKPNCPKCRMTAMQLSKVMPVQTITADTSDYERFRAAGYKSMPVVTVYQSDGTHDTWSDMRVDKIKQYTKGDALG